MENKSYYITRDKKKKEAVYLEIDKLEGYNIKPKVSLKDEIEVSKIVFVNNDLSEKIIRKKIDTKINKLLDELKKLDDNDDADGGESATKKTLMDAEKLKVQIINNYVKYLGHTYESLTLKKIQLITNQLRYKLYVMDEIKKQQLFNHLMFYNNDYDERESRRGR